MFVLFCLNLKHSDGFPPDKEFLLLFDGLVFDSKSSRFQGDLKFGSRDFTIQFNNSFETSCDQWFSALLGHINHLINLVQIKWPFQYLFNLRLCLGTYFLLAHHLLSASISSSAVLKLRQQGKYRGLSKCHFSSWLEKRKVCLLNLPSQAFEKRTSVQL